MAETANNANYDDVKIEGLATSAASMVIKDIKSPMPQYVRIKYTGAGAVADLSSTGTKAELWFKLRKR